MEYIAREHPRDDVTNASARNMLYPRHSTPHQQQHPTHIYVHTHIPQRQQEEPRSHMPQTRAQKRDIEMEAALRTFFASPRFAVAGASSDPSKYGHKGEQKLCNAVDTEILIGHLVFAWYLDHSLPVTPLNPRVPSITIPSVSKTTYTTTSSPSQLTNAPTYSLSVITPPAVTKTLLKEAKEAGVPAVWLQPGSFDKEVVDYARENFKAAIAGEGGGGGEGWCVLVDGEAGLKAAGREWSRL
jgi:predicted CoA-binding protein